MLEGSGSLSGLRIESLVSELWLTDKLVFFALILATVSAGSLALMLAKLTTCGPTILAHSDVRHADRNLETVATRTLRISALIGMFFHEGRVNLASVLGKTGDSLIAIGGLVTDTGKPDSDPVFVGATVAAP
jgi:hypothetical protein